MALIVVALASGQEGSRWVREQIVGHFHALSGVTGAEETVMFHHIARDYDIPVAAVVAALLYYDVHRGPIDARLEANAAALGWRGL